MMASRSSTLTLGAFSARAPPYRTDQRRALDWLAEVHAESQATVDSSSRAERAVFAERMRRVVDRCACDPTRIGARGHVVADVGATDWGGLSIYDVTRHPRGKGAGARSRLFADAVNAYFEAEYAAEETPPGDLVHVTCTGYVSPSGAQRLVQSKSWGRSTRVTHAYHMGCYAAFPAIRMGVGSLCAPEALASSGACRRVDIVHTEIRSLHLDPSNHSVEQLVVQSLFGDGFIRYSILEGNRGPGLRLLALDERLVPDSSEAMSWTLSDWGMQMTLAREVPERIAAVLREFVADLYRKAGIPPGERLAETIFAVHPGGPKIIDGVRDVLELSEAQVQASREVLYAHGNMSSATLPHVWMGLLADEKTRPGTPVLSLAFGPGLTLCGALFEKQ